MVLCNLPYRGLLVSPLVSADGKEERSLYVDRDKRRPMPVVHLDHSYAAAQQFQHARYISGAGSAPAYSSRLSRSLHLAIPATSAANRAASLFGMLAGDDRLVWLRVSATPSVSISVSLSVCSVSLSVSAHVEMLSTSDLASCFCTSIGLPGERLFIQRLVAGSCPCVLGVSDAAAAAGGGVYVPPAVKPVEPAWPPNRSHCMSAGKKPGAAGSPPARVSPCLPECVSLYTCTCVSACCFGWVVSR